MAEVNHFIATQDTVQSTSSTSYVNVSGLSISGASLTANTKYLIICRALIVHRTDTTNHVQARVSTADDTNIATKSEARYECQRIDTGDFKRYFFVHSYSTDASPADVVVQLASPLGGSSEIDQATLLLIDLDDLGASNYVEDINAGTGTDMDAVSPTRYDMATIAGSSLGTTNEWWVLGYGRVQPGASGQSHSTILSAAHDAATASDVGYNYEESEDGGVEYRLCGFASRHKAVTSNVDLKIQSMDDTATGNFTDEGSYLIAIKTAAFADFEWVYTAGNVSIGTSETTTQSLGPYTPTVAGNHLIIGQSQSNNTGSDLSAHMEDGTTELRSGDVFTTTQTNYWDSAKDLEVVSTFDRLSFSAAKTFNLRQQTEDAAGAAQRRELIVVNLNLAAADSSGILSLMAGTGD